MSMKVEIGESIEGRKIKGSSRKPVDYKGITLVDGKKFHKFVAKFNTKSRIIEKLEQTDEKIIEDSCTEPDAEILCDDVLLRSVDKKYSTDLASNASATHGTNVWSFQKQTNAMITKSHEEISNAIQNRRLEYQEKKYLKN